VRPSELVAGNCYFRVGYGDHNLLLPLIQTLLYVGVEEDTHNGRQLWSFSEPSLRGPAEEAEAEEAQAPWVFPEEQLHPILDLGGLMGTLMEVASEHPLQQAPAQPGSASAADLGTLDAEVARFFQSPELQTLTITVRFTDDGLSLTRLGVGSVNLLLFPHPRRNPAHEAALRAICENAALTPIQDYLADRGRTRVLVYSVPEHGHVAISRLAGRIFLEAYDMRRGTP